MENFKEILTAIINKTIDYGRKREYFLFLTEDKDLYLLKRSSETGKDGFRNEYDGITIWSESYVDWETYVMFMNALNIETNS